VIRWSDKMTVYLHRQPVDFRKAINGLSVIVQDEMGLSPFDPAIFVFCNKRRSQLKVLYWDATGFALWQKRLEQEKFKWPSKHADKTLELDNEQWHWLLRGFDIGKIKPHKSLKYTATN
jgi:transposase